MTTNNTTIKQALLMAAGKGSRLRPLTDNQPKPMIKVGGKPILEWTIETLPSSVEEIVIVVGYLKEQIVDYFGDTWNGKNIKYVEQTELKGTGHVIHIAAPLLQERFLVLNGDDLYIKEDLEQLITHEMSVLGIKVENNSRFGLLSVSDDGYLLGVSQDTPQQDSGIINIGAYVIDKSFLNYELIPIGDGSEFGLPQTIGQIAKDRRIKIVEANNWLPIGFPEDVEKANNWLNQHKLILKITQ